MKKFIFITGLLMSIFFYSCKETRENPKEIPLSFLKM